jgi:hypothetical protein
MKLTTHLQLVQRSRMDGVSPVCLLHVWCWMHIFHSAVILTLVAPAIGFTDTYTNCLLWEEHNSMLFYCKVFCWTYFSETLRVPPVSLQALHYLELCINLLLFFFYGKESWYIHFIYCIAFNKPLNITICKHHWGTRQSSEGVCVYKHL